MRNFKYIIFFILLIIFSFVNCKNEDEIVPANIYDISVSSEPGYITLHWKIPEDSLSIQYIKVTYYDPLLKKDVLRTGSIYSDTMHIPNTRKKYGEYTFKIQPISHTDTGGDIHEISITSEIAPATFIDNILTISELSSNAQEPSEGPIANLIDGNLGNFFHSRWSDPVPPSPHWFQGKLSAQVAGNYKIFYGNRSNGSNKPTDFDLMGSTDGEEWFLIKNFTKEKDNLNVASSGTWTSTMHEATRVFNYVRFVVNQTNTGTVFFTMSEFRIYSITKVDPEDPNVDI